MHDPHPRLLALGWDADWAAVFARVAAAEHRPARVIRQDRGAYIVETSEGRRSAEPTGRLWRDRLPTDLPCVGDWVHAAEVQGDPRLTLHGVLPRRSLLARKGAGETSQEQPIAANVDVLFVVVGLDGDFSLRRIERYVTLARDSGARPIIVLNKADLCDAPELRRAEVEALEGAESVLVCAATTSATTASDSAALATHVGTGVTAAFVGSSGVGKSTLANLLLGEELLSTGGVREQDGKGRHTTTQRQLLMLPSGGCIIDTPGMRELALSLDAEGLAEAFAEVMALGSTCRFADCRHEVEPGCAVRGAVDSGALTADRLEGFRKLRAENERLTVRRPEEERARERRGSKMVREAVKHKRDRGR